MADKDKNLIPDIQETTEAVEENTSENDALNSFLDSETSDERNNKSKKNKGDKKKGKKIPKNLLLIIIGVVIVAIIVVAVLLLLSSEEELEPAEIDPGTNVNYTVDENGEHQAALVLNKDGKLDNNSYGDLISYTPSDIKKIDIENESGTYTVLAKTEKTKNEETGEETTDATVYTLVGYEDINMQSGGPDTIANDCCAVSFLSVADITGDNASDFGFDSPRATVKTTFTDDTSCTIIVGDVAPNQSGTYIMFGKNKTVYLVNDEQVDGLLFSVLDLMPLTVNDSATSTENSFFESVTISGSAFKQSIEIRPNEDKAIDSSFVMISPKKMYVSEVEAANISGAIRGLYAEKAVCVNPSDSQLSKYGLKNPYAKISAIYPDATITLRASKPKEDNVYIISENNIIYQMKASAVPWVSTSVDKLTPDVVIDPNFESLSKIVVTDSSGTYTFDTTTVTESTESADGVAEDTTSTTAIYKGKTLDADNFSVFYHNIGNMKNAGKATQNGSGKPVLTISLSYSTGRATDTIKVYPTGSSKYIAELNGNTLCLVYKSYCTKFSQCVQDLINGKTVSSF